MEVHFGTQRTASTAFSQCFVFRNSQVEDISSFQPTNTLKVSDSNNDDLNNVEEEVSRFLTIWGLCVLSRQSQ